jgi:hypothetical protein
VNSERKLKKGQNLVFEKKKDEVVNKQFENQQKVMEKKGNLNDLNDLNDVHYLSNQDER